eukprot:4145268-Amphidinium_carterae.1
MIDRMLTWSSPSWLVLFLGLTKHCTRGAATTCTLFMTADKQGPPMKQHPWRRSSGTDTQYWLHAMYLMKRVQVSAYKGRCSHGEESSKGIDVWTSMVALWRESSSPAQSASLDLTIAAGGWHSEQQLYQKCIP